MSIEFRYPKPAEAGLLADRRVWLTRDESRMVEDGSPEAAFLLATPGTVIPSDVAGRLGLAMVDGRVVHRNEPHVTAVADMDTSVVAGVPVQVLAEKAPEPPKPARNRPPKG